MLSPPGGAPGHCHKTRSIFTHFMREATKNKNLRWLVIADDDTLLGVSKLVNLIGCYDDIDDSLKWPVALGQRYGRYYAVHQMQGQSKSSKIDELGNSAKLKFPDRVTITEYCNASTIKTAAFKRPSITSKSLVK